MVVLFEEKKLIKKSEDFFIMIHIMRKNMASNKETVLEIIGKGIRMPCMPCKQKAKIW